MEALKDPYGPTYPNSPYRFKWYRIFLVMIAIGLIFVGKSSIPSDKVECIEDVLLNYLQPITNFYNNNVVFGVILLTLMQLIVDVQLVGSIAFWMYKGISFKYPILLAIFGITKVFLNLTFQTKQISNNFTTKLLPSLVFGSNFQSNYFFSGVIGFLTLNLLFLRSLGLKNFFYIQLIFIVYSAFLLLSMRQNFLMDIVTSIIFIYYLFQSVSKYSASIDDAIIHASNKFFNDKKV